MYKQERDSVCFRKGVTTSMETSLLAIVLLRKKMRWEPLSIRMCLGGWDLENVTSCSCFILFHWFHSDIQVATLNKRPLHSKLVLSLYSHRSAVHMCRSVYISIYIYIHMYCIRWQHCRNPIQFNDPHPSFVMSSSCSALRWKAPGALCPSFRRSRSWSSLRLADDCFQCAFRFKGTVTCAVFSWCLCCLC